MRTNKLTQIDNFIQKETFMIEMLKGQSKKIYYCRIPIDCYNK